MSPSPVFDLAADTLCEATGLERPEVRGMLRMALKKGRFDPRAVSAAEMTKITEHLLPDHLLRYGVEDPDAACAALVERLAALPAEEGGEGSPEEVFSRLIRR